MAMGERQRKITKRLSNQKYREKIRQRSSLLHNASADEVTSDDPFHQYSENSSGNPEEEEEKFRIHDHDHDLTTTTTTATTKTKNTTAAAADGAKRRWRQRNPEKVRECRRRWQQANPDRLREVRRRWRQKNPQRARELAKRWQTKNSAKIREYARRWREKNHEERREAMKRWRQANNPDKIREYTKRWQQKNPEKAREAAKRYRQKSKLKKIFGGGGEWWPQGFCRENDGGTDDFVEYWTRKEKERIEFEKNAAAKAVQEAALVRASSFSATAFISTTTATTNSPVDEFPIMTTSADLKINLAEPPPPPARGNTTNNVARCVVAGCEVEFGRGIALYGFPCARRQPERRAEWFRRIGLQDGQELDPKSSYFVCRCHFDSSYVLPTRNGAGRLTQDAVPAMVFSLKREPEEEVEISGEQQEQEAVDDGIGISGLPATSMRDNYEHVGGYYAGITVKRELEPAEEETDFASPRRDAPKREVVFDIWNSEN